jgi:hypothetical protein
MRPLGALLGFALTVQRFYDQLKKLSAISANMVRFN